MNTEIIILAVAIFVGPVVLLLVWWFALRREGKRLLEQAQREAAQVSENAERLSETRLREADIVAKEKLLQARTEFETVSRKRRGELETQERRLSQKEDNLDRKSEELARRDKEFSQLDRALTAREKNVEKREAELEAMFEEERIKLEQIAGLTAQQARDELVRMMEDDARIEAAHIVKRIEDEAREQAGKQAQRIIGMAVQRSASDYVSETTVSVVMLPSDEMKGRIIGREGRNIRALEMATGVDLIVDDTPEAVILSGFDPFRREVARVALERLIVDGRIHPARIEEIVAKVRTEVEGKIRELGELACLEVGVHGIHPELQQLLGRLHYRTSYGQNILRHSIEVAHLAGMMAAEIGMDQKMAKRAGLMHDIGKAIDHDHEGTHPALGMELAAR
ncbi:MAG TPA: ribonuclease Y, partial [Thermoanaerobaculia bacterium]|nr:ribonuclease Y [Thermoanaerobaculia bacterium]